MDCSSKDITSGEERAAKYYPYWITTTLRPTETEYFLMMRDDKEMMICIK